MGFDITTRTERLERFEDEAITEIRVVDVKGLPDRVAEVRARAKALLVSGLAETVATSAKDLSIGEVERRTEIVGVRGDESTSGIAAKLVKDKIYTVRVAQ
jgi:hypothetical protein